MENEVVIEDTECVSSDSDLTVILEENGDNETFTDYSSDEVGTDDVESTQFIEVVDLADVSASNMSYNDAVLFSISMIVGLFAFYILSRRW